jgi:glycosyltransferase involved in cell wall biosynthesis
MNKRILPRVAIVGARGIPASYGGFETFAEEIAVQLVEHYGYQITVVCDAEQEKHNKGMTEHRGVQLRYSSYAKGKNAIRFYRDSIRRVAADHDIVYSCGPAGGMFAGIVHRHGGVMLTNPDGLNSRRAKWSRPVQLGFRAFEWLSSRLSDVVVCDSLGIEDYIRSSYGVRSTYVAEYGAYENPFIDRGDVDEYLQRFGLMPDSYHLVISRLEPENNVETIVRGFSSRSRKYPLVVVGNLKDTAYVRNLQACSSSQVHFLGGIYERDLLAAVRAKAISYFHGHSVGGTNPSLLEAMGSRNLCICHDNVFNREVVGDLGMFFSSADEVDNLVGEIESGSIVERVESMGRGVLEKVRSYYNWKNMAKKYDVLFRKVVE